MQLRRVIPALSIALLMAVSSVASAAAFNKQSNQPAQPSASDPVSGKYEGVAKSDQLGDIPITVELKNDNGKVSGKIDTPQGSAPITSGTYADGKITIKFDVGGQEGTVNAAVTGDKITGKWDVSGTGGPLELKRVGAAAAAGGGASGGAKPAASSADPITGEWDGTADAQGSSIAFTLKLKLDGEKVTGETNFQQTVVPISKGTWKDEKLNFTLDTAQGPITITAALKGGKLVGEFDFGGQMKGAVEAKKK